MAVVAGSGDDTSYHRGMPWIRHATIALVIAIGTLGAGACGPTDRYERAEARAVDEVGAEFGAEVDQLIETLGVTVESMSMRANRCDAEEGAGDDIFHIWIGMRARHDDRDVDVAIEQQHSRWMTAGWPITRFREVEGGGFNLAATDPKTGAAYALDSGFDEDPDSYVVGTFTTVCFRDPSGAVTFGPL
ncbi:hypothetical protein FB566_3375 [Stackebrandtia endophytica]|uniref:Uncharacterized protein n=2 Tax=Stackebrandtia endophytica TaxID=1496996 RepID=A0A543AZ09_9ACTN|nr:hypothetical protein FB566_3375 [Stackebrandtia endophytica]